MSASSLGDLATTLAVRFVTWHGAALRLVPGIEHHRYIRRSSSASAHTDCNSLAVGGALTNLLGRVFEA